ncbi:ankyrin repeat protein [Fusarium sporotrichioides]|uniref:Ankyrin repeat protein n=1 Tax=Fusarium sporotrichioides TaxID=5514 RepID=A0A395RFI3_FUSSP|nr:ankyrin repeat protein [Fusarium sporotrichioides]
MEHESLEGIPTPTLFALSEKSVAALNQAIAQTTDSTTDDFRLTLEDERGRLRVWASNLGALQSETSKKSLDYRLRDAPLMRTTVTLGLENLNSSADRVLAILNGSIPNRSASVPSDDLKTGNTRTINELDELIAGIHSAINHLFGISILIRKHQPRGRLLDLDDFTLESSQDITYVADKFPKAKSDLWLARRLGNNISKQRKVIQYRQEHRASLAKESVHQSGAGDTATVVATTYQERDSLEASNQVPKGVSSSRMSAFTSATSFQSLEDGEGAGRSIPDLSDITLDGVQLQYGEPFECPYCRTIQIAENRQQWKRHVFTDLQPYMCTFRNCKSGNKSFSTRGEWFEHESYFHRWQWDCSWCNSPNGTFPSSEEFRQHLNKSHPGMVTEAQMPLIVEACERPIKTFDSGSCPLCEDWRPASANNNAKGFSRHLARHLQQLSLASIPISTPGLEIKISDDASEVGDGSSNGSCDRDIVQQEQYNTVPANWRPLWSAVQRGHGDVIIELLDKEGADVNETDIHGKTALSYAVEKGHESVVRLLLERGANDSKVQTPQGERQQSVPQGPQQSGKGIGDDNILLIHAEGKKKATDAAAAEEAAKKAVQEWKAKIQEETKAKIEKSNIRADQAPIRFRDAVGRKFSFPFHLCSNWQAMEDLIKQAFEQVDVLRPHVMEGHYDLIGPDDCIGTSIVIDGLEAAGSSAWKHMKGPSPKATISWELAKQRSPRGLLYAGTAVYTAVTHEEDVSGRADQWAMQGLKSKYHEGMGTLKDFHSLVGSSGLTGMLHNELYKYQSYVNYG